MKRMVCLFVAVALSLLSTLVALAETPDVSDLFRYIPTAIIVDGDEAKVTGYFINMSGERITGIDEEGVDLEIYVDADLYLDGHFNGDSLRNLTLDPYSMKSFYFTYTNGGRSLKDGYFIVDSNCYAIFTCQFYYK